MADDITIDNGALTDYDVATDDDGSGNHIQLVKLTYSADGGRTAIPADANGLLVNLGANNDVTVTGSVSTIPTTSGGLTTYHLVSAASTNATVVKASAGQLYGYYIYNSNASVRKVAFHNTASTPTAGASIYFSIPIPPTSGANVEFTNGIPFSSGIAFTTVTTVADSGSSAVAVDDLVINLFYK